ncbi:asparagine synthase-related protein [Sphingomonas qomolangmaensis]|uniref:asparagine synthase (glutamine-hydrolyzing) n=1 Tax=Sphingomonas qomolangmaensis TaxID=2918765 RepID=A0ABY5L6P5_9SPHN|nr:asparagine synthase-related protein [Sphingomonas qomolangmaensis]UUL82452.1 asparagine synthase-related protein [Sphingomonas qomolangmaensis]
MSAIYGIVRFDGAPVDAVAVERMSAALAHRGPDGRETLALDSIGFGHHLMQVNVEDRYEAQPLRDPSTGVLLVADIRLDNRETVAAAVGLAPDALPTLPDSALLLAAYLHWGEDCVDHLIGDYAFVVWDRRRAALLLVRDPMGQRGLFFHLSADCLVFASEVKALWCVDGVPRRLSEVGIGRRLLFPIDPAPWATLYDGIEALPGGTAMTLAADGGRSVRSYWQPHADPVHLDRDDAYYLRTYRAVIEEAIACRVRRLIAPSGLLFSGGFDSGTIAAVAGPIAAARGRRLVAAAALASEGVEIQVRDAREAVEAFSDRADLDILAYHRGEDSIFDALEANFAATDNAAGADVRHKLFALVAARGVRLAMDGHGGDYTVNSRAPWMLGHILRRGELRRFARECRARRRATGRTLGQMLRHDIAPALIPLRLIAWQQAWRRGGRSVLRDRAVVAGFAQPLFDAGAIDPSRLRQPIPAAHRWRERAVHLLRRVSQAPPSPAVQAAALGLDLTRPFHDRRVVEFGLAIPERLQFRDGLERPLARTAFADRLPARLLQSGPGNDAQEPELFEMAATHAPAALDQLRQDAETQRYVDFDRLDSMIAGADARSPKNRRRLHIAMHAIVTARFIAWFDRANR